jgi:hypothetical protein
VSNTTVVNVTPAASSRLTARAKLAVLVVQLLPSCIINTLTAQAKLAMMVHLLAVCAGAALATKQTLTCAVATCIGREFNLCCGHMALLT